MLQYSDGQGELSGGRWFWTGQHRCSLCRNICMWEKWRHPERWRGTRGLLGLFETCCLEEHTLLTATDLLVFLARHRIKYPYNIIICVRGSLGMSWWLAVTLLLSARISPRMWGSQLIQNVSVAVKHTCHTDIQHSIILASSTGSFSATPFWFTWGGRESESVTYASRQSLTIYEAQTPPLLTKYYLQSSLSVHQSVSNYPATCRTRRTTAGHLSLLAVTLLYYTRSYLSFKTHFNIIFSYNSKLPKLSPSFRLSNENLYAFRVIVVCVICPTNPFLLIWSPWLY